MLQLLDLHGKQSYLLCDITKAYDRLVSMDMLEGYSAQAMGGRVEVLNMLKESALLRDGKVQHDKGLDLPMALMPSALALLAQVSSQQLVLLAKHLVAAAQGRSCQRGHMAHTFAPACRCSPQADLHCPLYTLCCPAAYRSVRTRVCMSWPTRPWQTTA